MPRIANAIARLRGKQASAPAWTPEPEHDDAWTPFRKPVKRQTKGRIFAALRNAHHPVNADHENRAGHRLYVKVNQTRQVRRNIVGFGRWRRHNESTEPSFAAQTSIPPMPPRSWRRPNTIQVDKAVRKARGRRITPVD